MEGLECRSGFLVLLERRPGLSDISPERGMVVGRACASNLKGTQLVQACHENNPLAFARRACEPRQLQRRSVQKYFGIVFPVVDGMRAWGHCDCSTRASGVKDNRHSRGTAGAFLGSSRYRLYRDFRVMAALAGVTA